MLKNLKVSRLETYLKKISDFTTTLEESGHHSTAALFHAACTSLANEVIEGPSPCKKCQHSDFPTSGLSGWCIHKPVDRSKAHERKVYQVNWDDIGYCQTYLKV